MEQTADADGERGTLQLAIGEQHPLRYTSDTYVRDLDRQKQVNFDDDEEHDLVVTVTALDALHQHMEEGA